MNDTVSEMALWTMAPEGSAVRSYATGPCRLTPH